MDLTEIAKKLGISDKHLIRKAAELRRLCDVQFDSSVIGVVRVSPHFFFSFHQCMAVSFGSYELLTVSISLQGEVCKAVICMEIAANRFHSSTCFA